MKKIKNFLNKFMQDRYGVDMLNQTLVYIGLIFSIIAVLVQNPNGRRIFQNLTLVVILYAVFRMLSKNINKRYQENIKFVKATKPIRAEIQILRLKWRDRKEYKYVRCDNCKNVMRVPKNKGKIKIKCRKCGNEFIKRV